MLGFFWNNILLCSLDSPYIWSSCLSLLNVGIYATMSWVYYILTTLCKHVIYWFLSFFFFSLLWIKPRASCKHARQVLVPLSCVSRLPFSPRRLLNNNYWESLWIWNMSVNFCSKWLFKKKVLVKPPSELIESKWMEFRSMIHIFLQEI